MPKWGHSPCTAVTHRFVLMVIFREVGYVSQEDLRDLQRPSFRKEWKEGKKKKKTLRGPVSTRLNPEVKWLWNQVSPWNEAQSNYKEISFTAIISILISLIAEGCSLLWRTPPNFKGTLLNPKVFTAEEHSNNTIPLQTKNPRVCLFFVYNRRHVR